MKKKIVFWWLLSLLFVLLATVGIVALLLRPRPLTVENINISNVEDGTYVGICQNKILFGVVQVEVVDKEITTIQVLEHKQSYMEQAESIADSVIQKQSLEVDAISGATLTSDTILKATEDALKQGISK